MATPKKLTLQDRIKRRKQTRFVGREEQIDLFRANLSLSLDDDQWVFIFDISGNGGMGKTALIGQFQALAQNAGYATALSNNDEIDIPSVLGRFAAQLEKQGHPLSKFKDRYRIYRQKRQELEADPEAPQGFSAAGRTVAKAGMWLGRQVSGAEAVATPMEDWASYVAQKLIHKDEVRLVQEPVEVLSPLFWSEISALAETVPVALFFDAYEQTSPFLDEWLLHSLDARHGDLPPNLLWVTAGRHGLDRNQWSDLKDIIAPLSLAPFTEGETRRYLNLKGITHPQVVERIVTLSGGLPLLVATLAVEGLNDPEKLGDQSDTAMAQFLNWMDQSERRQLVLDAALSQQLNPGIVAQLQGDTEMPSLFEWLTEMPFVHKHREEWVYHEVVRTQMLRHKRQAYPQRWPNCHCKLATYYEAQRDQIQLKKQQSWRDPDWQSHTLNGLYHRLCQSPQNQLTTALNGFLAALKNQRSFAERWAGVMGRAGQDVEVVVLQAWGERLQQGLVAYGDKRYSETLEMFTALLNFADIEQQWKAMSWAWRGEIHWLMNRYGEALKDFNRAIQINPNSDWAIACRGETYRLMNRYGEALKDFNRAIQINSNSDWAIAQRGETYRLMNCHGEALKDFNRAIELNPTLDWTIAQRGQTYRSMNRHQESLKDFDRVVQNNPKSDWAIAQRGQIYRLMNCHREALKDFSRAIELNPEYHWAISRRGLTYRLMKRHEEALKDFERAIQLNPKDNLAITLRGETYQSMQHYEEALKDFSRAIELNPTLDWAISRRGETYRLMERYGEALKDFDHAIQINPKADLAIAHRGETYRLMERYEDALKDFDRAIAINPKSDWAIANRGETYRAMKRYGEALQDFDRAIAINPEYDWAIAIRGKTYRLMERYGEALKDFDRAIQINPAYDWVIASRGKTYRQLQRYGEALKDFERIIAINPEYSWAIASRGTILLLLGQFHEALIDLNHALTLKSNDWYFYLRGIAYQTLHQSAAASQDFKTAITLVTADYQADDQYWLNTFNLAIYHLAAGDTAQAKQYYRQGLQSEVPKTAIQDAIQALTELLIIFPNHPQVTYIKQVIEKQLQARTQPLNCHPVGIAAS